MNFEDIVDMDWFNSHTIEGTSLPSPPIISESDMIVDTKEMLVLPSTEQIKQLIEAAKKQLELREQLASCQVESPEPESPISMDPSMMIPKQSQDAMSLEDYAAHDGIDIKKLNSKERRQLRNKISARNFRVRRKEYITRLEGEIDEQKKENEQLFNQLNQAEEENKQLKLQLESLKCQHIQLTNDHSILVGS